MHDGRPEPTEPTTPEPKSPIRLFGFHHAGGTAAIFAGWRRRLAPAIDVVPVTLPGRGTNGWNRRFPNLTALAAELAEELGGQLDRPHVFYGHSMGATVAYHLARLREEQGRRPPDRLLVGAFAAPHRAGSLRGINTLTDAQLVDWLVATSASPELVSAHLAGSTRRDVILARVREDLRLCSAQLPAGPPDSPPLSCPIHVFVGMDDPLVSREHAGDWSAYSRAGYQMSEIPGGHFFPRESAVLFFDELRAAVQLRDPAVAQYSSEP